jgi:type II secretory pathway component GspD/PulD (secretin)
MLKPLVRLTLSLLAGMALPVALGADSGETDAAVVSPGGSMPDRDSEIARLEAIPASHIPLKNATLASVIRLLAESAGMPYLAPPDADFTERINSDVTMNPYRLLQVLAENYGFGFDYDGNVWRFYRINLNELVTKAYTLRFNDPDQTTVSTTSINSQLQSATSGSSMGGFGAGAGAASGGSGGRGAAGRPNKIIADIKQILGIPTVGLETPALDGSPSTPGASADRKSLDAPRVDPIWDADTNQLFVVATRQQHSLIAAYLKAIDRPQRLIRVAVKFVETSRNPTQALGVDWSKTFLGSGGPISLSGASSGTSSTTVTSTIPSSAASNGTTVTTTTTSGSNSGSSSSSTSTGAGSGSSTSSSSTSSLNPINIIHPQFPLSLLSAPAFQWTVQAIASDQYSAVVQDPVIYTSNNRAVSFDATTQEPIQQGSTTIGSGTAATSSQIAYIDVGTELNLIPSILPGRGKNQELIQLNLAINVSSIVGTQVIGGNPYPITSSRTYNYTVAIPNGETLAIAGLEQRTRQTTTNKVPIFGDIPLIGYAFKNTNDSIVHTTLIAFITPELLGTDEAQSSEADAALPALTHRVFRGSKTETLKDVDKSLAGLPVDIAAAADCANAANRQRVLNRLDLFGVELELIEVRLTELNLTENKKTDREETWVEQYRGQLDAARTRVVKIAADSSES